MKTCDLYLHPVFRLLFFYRLLIDRERIFNALRFFFFFFHFRRNRRTFFHDDIFTYLNEVADDLPPGLTVNSIAASWINRDRVPLVTVIRDYKTEKINLSQVKIERKSVVFRKDERRRDFRTDKER